MMIRGFGAFGQETPVVPGMPGGITSMDELGQQVTSGLVVELGNKQEGNYKCYEPTEKQAAEGKKAMCVGSKQFYTMSHLGALAIGGAVGFAICKMMKK